MILRYGTRDLATDASVPSLTGPSPTHSLFVTSILTGKSMRESHSPHSTYSATSGLSSPFCLYLNRYPYSRGKLGLLTG